MSPQRLCTDSQMLLRRGEARTEIRGQSGHTDPDEEVLLLNFGIFTTSLCLLCGCWQSHVHTETKGELCVCYCGPLRVEQPSEKCLVGILEKTIRHILSNGLAVVRTVIFRSLFLSLSFFFPSVYNINVVDLTGSLSLVHA